MREQKSIRPVKGPPRSRSARWPARRLADVLDAGQAEADGLPAGVNRTPLG
jgi:hypothetical protein